MNKCLSFKGVQTLIISLMLLVTFGCSETEEPEPEEIKDSLYFKFTLDGNQYFSEIKESNLIPETGNENIDDPSNGVNFLMYASSLNSIWMHYSNNCGTASGKDCLDFIIYVPENLKIGTYPSIFTYGIRVNGQNFVQSYSGPELSPRPENLTINLVIEKYDAVNNIVEGTVKGKFYKSQNPSAEKFDLEGEFRVYLFTN